MRMPPVVAPNVGSWDGDEHNAPVPMVNLTVLNNNGVPIPASDPWLITLSVGDVPNAPTLETLYTFAFPVNA